jgi:hypothetical protein
MKLFLLSILLLAGCCDRQPWMVSFPRTYVGQDASVFFRALDSKKNIKLVHTAEEDGGTVYIFEEWHHKTAYWRIVTVKDGHVVGHAI